MEDSQNQAAGMLNKIRDGAISQLNVQKDRSSEGLSSVIGAVRSGTQKLRDENHETIAEYVDDAASQLDRVANHLRTTDTRALLQEAQRFARRNPPAFIGSAFAVGLIAARFFKSSADRGQSATSHGPVEYGSAPHPHLEAIPVGTGGVAPSTGSQGISSVSESARPTSRRSTGSPSPSFDGPLRGERS